MTPDITWTIIGTGIAIVVMNIGLFAWQKSDMAGLNDRLDGLQQRIARIEGKMDLLLQGFQVRIGLRGTKAGSLIFLEPASPSSPSSVRSRSAHPPGAATLYRTLLCSRTLFHSTVRSGVHGQMPSSRSDSSMKHSAAGQCRYARIRDGAPV